MPLKFADLKDAVRHTLGGDPAPGASYGRIINGAGRAWTAAREWYYLAHREATLLSEAGSEWVELPTDYDGFGDLIPDADNYASVQMLTPPEFLLVKENNYAGTTTAYVGTIVNRNVDGVIAPWLRLFPAPSLVERFTLLYNATWGDVADDGEVIPIPAFAEHAFEEWVRLYARGLEEEDAVPLALRLVEFKASDMFRDVVRRDALQTGATMHLTRGAADVQARPYVRWNHPGNIG